MTSPLRYLWWGVLGSVMAGGTCALGHARHHPGAGLHSLPPVYFGLPTGPRPARPRLMGQRYPDGAPGMGSLRLVARPTQYGTSDLRVDVAVWNRSRETKRIYPFHPLDYQLEFRDAGGRPLHAYTASIRSRRVRQASELVRLEPGNHLGATYLLPRYYQAATGTQGARLRVVVDRSYVANQHTGARAWFGLASEWVPVPAH